MHRLPILTKVLTAQDWKTTLSTSVLTRVKFSQYIITPLPSSFGVFWLTVWSDWLSWKDWIRMSSFYDLTAKTLDGTEVSLNWIARGICNLCNLTIFLEVHLLTFILLVLVFSSLHFCFMYFNLINEFRNWGILPTYLEYQFWNRYSNDKQDFLEWDDFPIAINSLGDTSLILKGCYNLKFFHYS